MDSGSEEYSWSHYFFIPNIGTLQNLYIRKIHMPNFANVHFFVQAGLEVGI